MLQRLTARTYKFTTFGAGASVQKFRFSTHHDAYKNPKSEKFSMTKASEECMIVMSGIAYLFLLRLSELLVQHQKVRKLRKN
jgi:hypothetical protein